MINVINKDTTSVRAKGKHLNGTYTYFWDGYIDLLLGWYKVWNIYAYGAIL